MRLITSDGDGAEIIVWTGGWADVGLSVGGDLSSPFLQFVDVDGASSAVEQIVAEFLSRANPDHFAT